MLFPCVAGSINALRNFDLGRCSIRPTQQDRYAAFGTDNPEAEDHFLSLLNLETLRKSILENPLVCYTRVSEHVSDVKWLNDSSVLASTGKGNLKLFSFDSEKNEIKHVGQFP